MKTIAYATLIAVSLAAGAAQAQGPSRTQVVAEMKAAHAAGLPDIGADLPAQPFPERHGLDRDQFGPQRHVATSRADATGRGARVSFDNPDNVYAGD
ncbi:hypothetical protein GCM10023144_19110 [Pigmentiphaga soli]|uniref:DUF4148 domain-containing protein n=1 Tax=Pigmentiphaga soli TaxID=1007095 RepID=A0ABP8GWG5_9BURK